MDIFLSELKLARCDDRNILAKENVNSGSPEKWFTQERLDSHNLFPISFDFFVNWSKSPLKTMRNIWIKSIINTEPDKVFDKIDTQKNNELVKNLIFNYYGESTIKRWLKFSNLYHLNLEFLMFRDVSWDSTSKEKILFCRISGEKENICIQNKLITLQELQKKILIGSGGPVHVGQKGLIYGTSLLECHLSKSSSAYPGDADLVLFDKSTARAFAIIEFKKHTLDSPTCNQRLGNYYPRPDRRKYERLHALKCHFNDLKPPLLANLYFPTKADSQSKIEIIGGKHNNLFSAESTVIDLPFLTSNSSMQDYVDTAIQYLRGVNNETI